jgi:hypothetical protein
MLIFLIKIDAYMDRTLFPNPREFTKRLGGGESGCVYTDERGIFAMKRARGSNIEHDDVDKIASISYEKKMLDYLSSIIPEYTPSPATLTKPLAANKRGSSIRDSPQSSVVDEYTFMLMPKIKNDAMTLGSLSDQNIFLSEYDALVCSMQAFLAFLCIGDSMVMDDMHPENVMLSPSITHSILDNNDGTSLEFIEREPRITFIDMGYYRITKTRSIDSGGSLENQSFRYNMSQIFSVIIHILRVCKIGKKTISRILNIHSKYYEINLKGQGIPLLADFTSKYNLFVVDIVRELKKFTDIIDKIPNIQQIEAGDGIISRTIITPKWKQDRDGVIANLMSRIEFMGSLRLSQIQDNGIMEAVPTWRLDQLLEDPKIRQTV